MNSISVFNEFICFGLFQKAKEQGAVFVRDIWSESDEFGTVRFATVKTVSIKLCVTVQKLSNLMLFALDLSHRSGNRLSRLHQKMPL